MKEYWEENLHELNELGFYNRLVKISEVFNNIVKPRSYKRPRLYFVIQDDLKFLKIGSSKNPHKRLFGLQTGNPHKLILLYIYDAQKTMEEMGQVLGRGWSTIQAEEAFQRLWLCGREFSEINGGAEGEWIRPDDRTFRILIKEGMLIIENLAKEMNINYSEL